MKLLTKDTDYAVRALLILAQNTQGFMSAREIADTDRMPYQYMRKVLQVLMKKGYIESKEGGQGGFKIKGQISQMGLNDIIRLFQGEIQLTECMFRKNICHNKANCVLRKSLVKIERKVIDEFKGITIESLLKEVV